MSDHLDALATVAVTNGSTGSDSGHSPAGAIDGRPKTTRIRKQLSCAECHRRKQSCNREIPCTRCIERNIADQCRVAEPGTNTIRKSTGSGSAPRKRKKVEDSSASSTPASNGLHYGDIAVPQAGPSAATLVANNPSDPNGSAYDYMGASSSIDFVSQALAQEGFSDSQMQAIRVPGMSCLQAYERASDKSLRHLMAHLPPRPICDRLVAEFYRLDFLHWWFSSSHRPSFQISYELIFACLADPTRPPVSLSCVAHLAMVMAVALQYFPTGEDLPGINKANLKDQLYRMARLGLSLSDMEETTDRLKVECILFLGIFAKGEGRPTDVYCLVAQAIRMAQGLGMHRRTASNWALSPMEDQLRKRLWLSLVTYDRGMSFHYGRPYCSFDQHNDANDPANINLADLTDRGPTNIRPLSEVTDTTHLLLSAQQGRILARIFDGCFSVKQPTYAEILAFDEELHAFDANLPEGLRSPKHEDLVAHPFIPQSYRMLVMSNSYYRCILHRSYVLKRQNAEDQTYERSRDTVMRVGRRAMSLMREYVAELEPHQRHFFLVIGTSVEVGLTMAVCAMAEARHGCFDRTRKLDEAVVTAIDILEQCLPRSPHVAGSIGSLKALRERYLALLPENSNPPGPSTADQSPGNYSAFSSSSDISQLVGSTTSLNNGMPAAWTYPANQQMAVDPALQGDSWTMNGQLPDLLPSDFTQPGWPDLTTLLNGQASEATFDRLFGPSTFMNSVV